MSFHDDPETLRDRRRTAYEKRILDISRKERQRLNREAAKRRQMTTAPRLVKHHEARTID